jgi:hypothetical protein
VKGILVCFYMLLIFGADQACGQAAPVANPSPVAVTAAPAVPVSSPADDIAKASQPVPTTVKDESAAPPAWVQDLVVTIKSMPILGPIAVKILNWLTVLFSIITALCAFLLVVLKALSGVANMASLVGMQDKIVAFQSSKFMWTLKYLSVFNAQKKPKSDAVVEQSV